ncbi:MAG: hypothetical protein VB064_10325 [Oscillospiraceae bacterium]|nr:hypothetical protein [Oscillospiraceae bacterium]
MKEFPNLSQWFDFIDYCDFNDCTKIELNMKKSLTSAEIENLNINFAKYLCRLRCSEKKDIELMYRAIDSGDSSCIPEDIKRRIILCFFYGFISDNKYSDTGDYSKSFDDDAIQGYMGECLYYLVREQYLKDEKKIIEPIKPKFYSKSPGIDFVEVRRDSNGFYMLIGEVKTTIGTISSRSHEIIEAFSLRADKTFAEIYQSLRGNPNLSEDPELLDFVNQMNDIFYYIGSRINTKKKYSGVVNYCYAGQRIRDTVFSKFRDSLTDKVFDDPDCRRIKLIGIYNIGDNFCKVRDIIWNCLLT